MAGGSARTKVYKSAHSAGAGGRQLPPGIAAQADSDPLIDQAHDAGRSGQSFDEFAQTNKLGPAPSAPGPNRRVARAAKKKSSSGIRRSGRTTAPTVLNPTGGLLPIGTGASFSIGGVAAGAVLYALLLSVADYGPTGPLLWFKAKFLNEATPAPAKASK